MNGLCTVDFHTHLNWQSPLQTSDDVLRIVSTPLTHAADPVPERVVQTLELHPWDGVPWSSDYVRYAGEKRFIALGEVGLDRIRGVLSIEDQKNIFANAVKLAQELNKPLTVHCVKCYPDLLELYKNLRWKVPTVIHYFRGKLPLAQQLWRQSNFILSLPPAAHNQTELWDFIWENPEYLNRTVLESDDPSADCIKEHYQIAAGKLDMSFRELQTVMTAIYKRIYCQ